MKSMQLIIITTIAGMLLFGAEALNASTNLGEGIVELCDQGNAEARQAWKEGQHLDAVTFKEVHWHNKLDVAAVAADWQTLHKLLDQHGKESREATRILEYAAGSGRMEIVENILDYGVSPNGNSLESVPLASAAGCGRTEMVKLLLERGANPNFQTESLQDAMTVAIIHNNWEMGQSLMEHGYDPCVLELKDGRSINDILDRMRAGNADYPAVWQQVECR